MSSEHARIERLKQVFAQAHVAGVSVGIGDDCAVLDASQKQRVWTIDSAVEHVHFRRDLMPLEGIAYRAFMAAASDIAAMGARATAALSSLILPSSLSDAELEQLASGIARAADVCACPVVGGNLARGSELSLTTTVLGEPYAHSILRSGARPGDGLYVTGPLGGAALGLAALLQSQDGQALTPYRQAFLSPRARLDVSERIAHSATSSIDLSDGLFQDAGHVAQASNVSLRIELAAIPRHSDFARQAALLSVEANKALLAGGEDYEILFTAANDAGAEGFATRIGEVIAGPKSVSIIDEHGRELQLDVGGFDHFRQSQ